MAHSSKQVLVAVMISTVLPVLLSSVSDKHQGVTTRSPQGLSPLALLTVRQTVLCCERPCRPRSTFPQAGTVRTLSDFPRVSWGGTVPG